jgi:hypothetical protein
VRGIKIFILERTFLEEKEGFGGELFWDYFELFLVFTRRTRIRGR